MCSRTESVFAMVASGGRWLATKGESGLTHICKKGVYCLVTPNKFLFRTATEYEEEHDSSIYFATTTPSSSPYMRSPGQGRALPSQDGLHDSSRILVAFDVLYILCLLVPVFRCHDAREGTGEHRPRVRAMVMVILGWSFMRLVLDWYYVRILPLLWMIFLLKDGIIDCGLSYIARTRSSDRVFWIGLGEC